jgi:hypothetical protein
MRDEDEFQGVFGWTGSAQLYASVREGFGAISPGTEDSLPLKGNHQTSIALLDRFVMQAPGVLSALGGYERRKDYQSEITLRRTIRKSPGALHGLVEVGSRTKDAMVVDHHGLTTETARDIRIVPGPIVILPQSTLPVRWGNRPVSDRYTRNRSGVHQLRPPGWMVDAGRGTHHPSDIPCVNSS